MGTWEKKICHIGKEVLDGENIFKTIPESVMSEIEMKDDMIGLHEGLGCQLRSLFLLPRGGKPFIGNMKTAMYPEKLNNWARFNVW